MSGANRARTGGYSLLVDVGSSAIKAKVVDDRPGAPAVTEVSAPAPAPLAGRPSSRHETDPLLVLDVVRDLLERVIGSAGVPVTRIAVSAQMHTALLTAADGRPLTPMISWQDDRLTEPTGEHGGDWLGTLTAAIPATVRRRSGIALRPGYGGGNLAVAVRQRPLAGRAPEGARLHTVGSYLATALGGPHATHLSSAAALGLVDLDRQDWSPELITAYGLEALEPPKIVTAYAPIGTVEIAGCRLDLFPDVGDHQASVLGGERPATDEVAISLGTAGIAARWSARRADSDHVDSRPYPGGGYLLSVSRLPGGRLADDLTGFLATTAGALTGEDLTPADVWERAGELAERVTGRTDVQVGEPDRPGGGRALAISGIGHRPDIVGEVLNAFVDYYVGRYREALHRLYPSEPLPRRVHFNGGLAIRSPWFRTRFAEGLGLDVTDCPDHDLALDGLRRLLSQHDALGKDSIHEPA